MMLPTAVFSRPHFALAAAVGFALNTGFFGQLFVLALFLQRYLGYEPWLAGLALRLGLAVPFWRSLICMLLLSQPASAAAARATASTGARREDMALFIWNSLLLLEASRPSRMLAGLRPCC